MSQSEYMVKMNQLKCGKMRGEERQGGIHKIAVPMDVD